MYASPADRNKSSISTKQLSTAHTHCYLYLGEKVCDSLLTPSEQLFQQYDVRIKFIWKHKNVDIKLSAHDAFLE